MTEDEAKTKWCPFVRVRESGSDARVVNVDLHGDDDVQEGSRCMGSACMAWRWDAGGQTLEANGRHLSGVQQDYGPTHWQEPDRPSYINDKWRWDPIRAVWVLPNEQELPTGYCGLAGKP